MAMKKSISRTLAHIDVAATLPFAFTKTFSTATGIITTYLSVRLMVLRGFLNRKESLSQTEIASDMRFNFRSGRAAWVKCIEPATRDWIAP